MMPCDKIVTISDDAHRGESMLSYFVQEEQGNYQIPHIATTPSGQKNLYQLIELAKKDPGKLLLRRR